MNKTRPSRMDHIRLEQTVAMHMPPPHFKERLSLIRSLLADMKDKAAPGDGPCLLVKDLSGKRLVRLREFMVVGADKTCELPLTCPYISRRHLRIFFKDGEWIVLDEHSTNGIYINGRKAHCALLNNGDIIQIGTVTLVFLTPSKQSGQPAGE